MRYLLVILCIACTTQLVYAQTAQEKSLEDLPTLGEHIIVKSQPKDGSAALIDTVIRVSTAEQVGQSLALTSLSGPVTKYLEFETNADFKSYEIYDKDGEIIVPKSPYKSKIDMSTLEKGTYKVKLVNADGEAGKLIIIKS